MLLGVDDYKRLKEDQYDDSPWTSEKRHALAWEAGKHAGWEDEDMDEYDRHGDSKRMPCASGSSLE